MLRPGDPHQLQEERDDALHRQVLRQPARRRRRARRQPRRNPFSRCVPKLSKNCPNPSASPFIRLLANFIGSSAMSLTTFWIFATTAQNDAGGIPSSSSSPSMMNLTGSSRNRLTAFDDPADQPAGLLAELRDFGAHFVDRLRGPLDQVLVEVVARRDRLVLRSLSSCPSNFACSAGPGRRASCAGRRKSSRYARCALLISVSHVAMMALTFTEISVILLMTPSPKFFSALL